MLRRLSIATATFTLAVAGAASAQEDMQPDQAADTPMMTPVEKPAPEAVRAFWEFYFNGKGQGVVLADAKPCLEVAKEGPNKSNCVNEVPAEGVKPGTVVYVWQAYLVPHGDVVEDISIQLKLDDQVRETKDVKVNGASIRYRSWNAFRIPKAGKWTFNIMRGGETLKSIEITASK